MSELRGSGKEFGERNKRRQEKPYFGGEASARKEAKGESVPWDSVRTRKSELWFEHKTACLASEFSRHLTRIIEKVTAPDEFGKRISIEAIAKEANWSKDTLDRWRTGRGVPQPEQFKHLASAIERLTPDKNRDVHEVQELTQQACATLELFHELPRTFRQKFEATRTLYTQATERLKASAATVLSLQDEIDSLGQQLASLSAGPSAVHHSQHMRDLRDRIAQLRKDLHNARQQRDENSLAVDICIQAMEDLMAEVQRYFDLVLGD